MDVPSWVRFLVQECKYKTPEALQVVSHLGATSPPRFPHPDDLRGASAADLSMIPKPLSTKLLRKAGLSKTPKRARSAAGEEAASRKKPAKLVAKPAMTHVEPEEMRGVRMMVKRSPVKMVLGAVAAQKAHDLPWDQAIAVGKAVSDAYAQMKAQHLDLSAWTRRAAEAPASTDREIIIMDITVRVSEAGVVYFSGSDETIRPANVDTYLSKALGDEYALLVAACETLVEAFHVDDLVRPGFLSSVWQRIRPTVPPGRAGWGYKGAMPLAAFFEEKEQYLAVHGEPAAEPDAELETNAKVEPSLKRETGATPEDAVPA